MFRIEEAEITNFKGVKFKRLKIGGKSFLITGKNGKGKSSLIQAINSAFSTDTLPPNPVTKGEEKAVVRMVLSGVDASGKAKEYTVQVSFKEDGKGTIAVYNGEMEKIGNTKSVVKEIFNYISFDILSFLRKSPTEQVKALKQLAGDAFCEQLERIDKDRKQKYSERTYLNQKVKDLEGKLKLHGYTPEQIELYMEPRSEEALKEKLDTVRKDQQLYDRINSGLETRKAQLEGNAQRLERIEKQIADLMREKEEVEKQMTEIRNEISKGEDWIKRNERPSDEAILRELDEITRHNMEHGRIAGYIKDSEELIHTKDKSSSISSEIEKLDSEKISLFSQSPLPVEGLSFNEDGVFYNDLPLDENQIERSMLIKIGTEIAMAMNPTLRVVSIQDASLLDHDSLKYIIDVCKKNEYQLIAEIVGEEEDPVIQFIEEEVK